MSKIVLATMGSLGDLYPFLAIGLALKEIGYDPILATHNIYQESVEAHGLRFGPMRPGAEDVFALTGLDMGGLVARASADPWFLLRDVYLPFTPMMFEDLTALSEGAAAIVAHNWAFGAIVAAEAHDIPLVRVAMSPLFLQSAIRPSVTGNAPYLRRPRGRLGISYNKLVRETVRRQLSRKMRPADALRRKLRLPAAGHDRVFDFGRTDPAQCILALYSAVFARLETDHSSKAVQCGFPRLDSNAMPMPRGLEDFLSAGSPPVIFTLGSFVVNAGKDFYANGLAACRALGERSVLIAGEHAEEFASATGPDAFVCGYAPHARLFPRARAIVHHGGIGTTGEALRSGKPQLVIPCLGDQPDNARRLVDLGVAREVRSTRKCTPDRSSVERLVSELGPLLANRHYRDTGAAVAAKLANEEGAREAAFVIDEMIGVDKMSAHSARSLPAGLARPIGGQRVRQAVSV